MRAVAQLSKILLGRSAQRLRVVVTLSMVFAFTFCSFAALARADNDSNTPAFKADVPKMDPNADKPAAPRKPLQAGIQQTAKFGTTPPLRSGAAANGNRGFLG